MATASASYESQVQPRRCRPLPPPRAAATVYAMVMATDAGATVAAPYKAELFRGLGDGCAGGGGVEGGGRSRPLDVVELGAGAGPNLRYYAGRPGVGRIVAVDPNAAMEKYLRSVADGLHLPPAHLDFVTGAGEALPLADASADCVVATLVLCSVTSVAATLEEVLRVLRPGGVMYFIEHVAAPEQTALRRWQDLLDPLQQLLADGCHLTRSPVAHILAAGFQSVSAQATVLDGLGLISPHIIGTARKAAV
eukprot:SM000062S19864  [mRNA]  locus=s62:136974:138314:+ [translate_table: standard]